MCKAMTAVRCPKCGIRLAVTRPDSMHPLSSLEPPQAEDVEGDVITQIYTCTNPDCKARITVYWHESKLF